MVDKGGLQGVSKTGSRVLVVADVSAETVHGGAERMLHHHLRALVAAGYEVTMLTRQPAPDAEICVDLPQFGIQEYRFPFSGDKGHQGLLELKKAAKQWWKHHQQSFDVVVSEQPFVMWALLEAGCRLPRLQVCHSLACEEYETRHALNLTHKHKLAIAAMRKLEAKVYHTAARVMVLSRYTQHKLQEYFSLMPQAFVLNPGAAQAPSDLTLDTRAQVRADLGWDTPVVSTLRNLVPRTGVDLLVQAAAILKNTGHEARFMVMGDGVLRDSLQKLAQALEVQDCVTFTGFLTEGEVQRRLLASDVFMVPTRGLEGFGLVTLEANVLGTPVLATPIAANAELVPSIMHNQLADNASPLALAEKLKWMLDNPLNEAQRRRTAEDALRQYSWPKHDANLVQSIKVLEGMA